MKKGIFIEIVFLRISGGRLNTDLSVKRVDIEAYLPACVNYALTKGYFTQQEQEQNRDLPTQFYTYFPNLTILTDTTKRNRKYVELPGTLIGLPSNRALRLVLDNCENTYSPVPEAQVGSLNHWLTVFENESFFRLREKKLLLYNVADLAETVDVEMIVSVSDLDDEAELPIPAGEENNALTMCVEFITGQRQIPTESKVDTNDINGNN